MSRISTFDPSDLKTRIAGEVKDFDPTLYMEPKDAKRNDRFIQFSIAASMLALRDAGLEITDDISERTGTFIGSGIGGMENLLRYRFDHGEQGPLTCLSLFYTEHSDQYGLGICLDKVQRQRP